MKKFEYKTIIYPSYEDMIIMNKLGEEGWELVSVLTVNEYDREFYFKKEIVNK